MTAEEKAAKRAEIKLKYKEFMKCYPLDTKSLADEIWADITGYEGEYQISTYGRIKSFKNGREIIMRPLPTRNGYLNILLCKDGRHKNFSVHVLVARAFIPNPDNKQEVNHIDGEKFNCHVSNLEWSNRSENNKHAFRIGLKKQLHGGDNPKANLTNEDARYCREVFKPWDKNFGLKALARKFGVSKECIRRIVHYTAYRDV